MRTVKDCERYNTVREPRLLQELPASPSPPWPAELRLTKSHDSCWIPERWLFPTTVLARRSLSHHHYHQVQRLFSSSSSMFSQHKHSLLVIFFPKLSMKMSVGWTMPPIPAPLLLPKELLVPGPLYLGNWICSSYCNTYLHVESPETESKPWAQHLRMTACQHLPLALTLVICESPASDQTGSPDSHVPPGHPILFSISTQDVTWVKALQNTAPNSLVTPPSASPLGSTRIGIYACSHTPLMFILHLQNPTWVSTHPEVFIGDFHSAVSPTPLKFHNTFILVFIWQLSCLTPLCYSY